MMEPIATSTEVSRKELRTRLIGPKASRALAFQNVAVKHFGPAAGIFCRQLLFWDGSGWDGEGWIYKSMNDWEKETGLTRRNWERARKVLTKKKVMEEKKAIGPDGRQRLFYRLDLAQLMESVGDDLPNAKPLTSAQDCTVLPSGDHAHYYRAGTMPINSDQAVQKSTQEITQKEVPPHTPQKGGGRKKRVKEQDHQPSPPAVIEAIRKHRKYGEDGTLKGIRAWKVAEIHDFTSEALIKKEISERLDAGSRREAEKIRMELERIARRAVEGEAVTDSPGLEDSSEGSGKGELTPDELEAVRREIMDKSNAANMYACRFWNGEQKLHEVVMDVWNAVNFSLFDETRSIEDCESRLKTILRDQKAYLDSNKLKNDPHPHRKSWAEINGAEAAASFFE